jgi:hypothetical protein
MTQNQVMANAPSPIKKAYFDNLSCSITAEAKVSAVEAENQKKIAELKKRELDLKECSVRLCESQLTVTSDDNGTKVASNNNVEEDKNEQVKCPNANNYVNLETQSLQNEPRWMQLLGTGLIVEAHHLHNAESGAEFACMHNCDSADFMNQE